MGGPSNYGNFKKWQMKLHLSIINVGIYIVKSDACLGQGEDQLI